MSIQIIRAALESKLAAWAASQSTPIPLFFQGLSVKKPANGSPFLESFLIPNVTSNRQVDGKHKTLRGLFHVNCWAQSGKGMGVSEGIAEAIVSLFPLIPKLGPVSIESTPSTSTALEDESGWVITPVLIKYRYEA